MVRPRQAISSLSRPPADRTGINGLGRPDRADYISLAQGSGNRFLIDQALANRDIRPRSFCEVKHVPELVSLAEAGLGVGVVPKLAMPADGNATLVKRSLTNPAISRPWD
ncbi:LysR substrate-binding domain-containing protein [Pseudomonas sp. PGPPP1]|uniref:LysR substrate-binding domain-containing protein n=1 Tax=Pseudomonas sp. PGPPP1 TaxID=2015553 RepID=UPI00338E2936